jgi:WD40 repeat protein
VDKTVRLWDLQLGMPVSISKLHGGTVRSVALDPRALVSGASDNLIRLWTPTTPFASSSSSGAVTTGVPTAAAAGGSSSGSGMDITGDQLPRRASSSRLALELEAAAAAAAAGSARSATDAASVASSTASQWLFDLTRTERQLKGHIGPVSTLCLTSSHLVSGSWDYTARVWQRGSWECVRVHKYSDWLASVVVRGPHLLVAAGPEVHVHDMGTGQLVRKVRCSNTNPSCAPCPCLSLHC